MTEQVKEENQELDTEYQDCIVCPYCGFEDYDDDSNFTCEEDTTIDCSSCGKDFDLSVHIHFTYTTSCIK